MPGMTPDQPCGRRLELSNPAKVFEHKDDPEPPRHPLLDENGRVPRHLLLGAAAGKRDERERKGHVYYIRLASVIKIGCSLNPRRRIGALCPDEVLALEPGYYRLERQRHQQFVHLRVDGELFAAGPDLLEHLEQLRAVHGTPVQADYLTMGRWLAG